MANRIYRGPASDQPTTINLPVNGALAVGILVVASATQLSAAGVANADDRLFVLANNEFAGQDTLTAYVTGDTGTAYPVKSGQEFACAMGAGAYTYGQPLMIDANARLISATVGKAVIAYFDGAGATLANGDLGDVVIADRVLKL
jgi:hypothetical protein